MAVLNAIESIHNWCISSGNWHSTGISGQNWSSNFRVTPSSVAVVITDVFGKKRINVSNKFVRIMKIFTKINDLKTTRVI